MKNIKSKLSRLEQLEKKEDESPCVVIYKPGEEPTRPKKNAKAVFYLPDNGRD